MTVLGKGGAGMAASVPAAADVGDVRFRPGVPRDLGAAFIDEAMLVGFAQQDGLTCQQQGELTAQLCDRRGHRRPFPPWSVQVAAVWWARDDRSKETLVTATTLTDAGAATYRRYQWQLKVVVQQWLSCLQDPQFDPPVAVVCEFIEDVVVLHGSRVVFMQLKTRDRGSWSDTRVAAPGNGIDSLCRTHLALNALTHAEQVRYALWLEGAASETRTTAAFFADPSSAEKPIRDRLRDYGLNKTQQSHFLARLEISPNRPPRATIDAVILREIGLLWPSLTSPECEQLYSTLLGHAARAQAAEDRRDGWVDPASHLVRMQAVHAAPPDDLPHRILTVERLRGLVPPLPSDVVVAPSPALAAATALTQKLAIAGATADTRTKAALFRAQAETRRQELLTTKHGARYLSELADRLLETAGAIVVRTTLSAGGNPRLQARVGDYVFNDLLSRPQDLNALDPRALFGGEHRAVLGFLCQLSDECRFAWREVPT